jgi:cell division transport system permease protein
VEDRPLARRKQFLMSISYTIRESFSGFTRTKLSSALSILTIAISLVILGIFMVVTIFAQRFLDDLRSRVEIEAFLQEPMTSLTLDSLAAAVASIEGVERVTIITKEEAARIFQEETGESILDVLDYNPLPPSLRISLKEGYKSADGAEAFENRLKGLAEIESVRYRKAFLEILDKRAATVHTVTLVLGILGVLSAIVLVSNTIRLAIYAKRQIITTMELVGATWSFIRLPFLLEGILQGLFGGVCAALLLYAGFVFGLRFISLESAEALRVDPLLFLLIVVAGMLLGFIGSAIAVVRFISPSGRR